MLRITLLDGYSIEVARDETSEFLPYDQVFTSSQLRSPVEGIITRRGKIIPVLGPLPTPEQAAATGEARPFLLVMKNYAQVIKGFPTFKDDSLSLAPKAAPQGSKDEARAMLQQLDELLKAA